MLSVAAARFFLRCCETSSTVTKSATRCVQESLARGQNSPGVRSGTLTRCVRSYWHCGKKYQLNKYFSVGIISTIEHLIHGKAVHRISSNRDAMIICSNLSKHAPKPCSPLIIDWVLRHPDAHSFLALWWRAWAFTSSDKEFRRIMDKITTHIHENDTSVNFDVLELDHHHDEYDDCDGHSLVITTTNSYCQYNDCCQSRTDKKKTAFPTAHLEQVQVDYAGNGSESYFQSPSCVKDTRQRLETLLALSPCPWKVESYTYDTVKFLLSKTHG